MPSVRHRNLQKRDRFGCVHALRRGNVLHRPSSDGADGLPRVSGQFKFPDSKLSHHGLHVQRWPLWTQRRPVRAVRRGNLQTLDRPRRVHELPGLLRRSMCGVYSVDAVRLHRLHRQRMHRVCVGIVTREH